jgi:hypothetical protein
MDTGQLVHHRIEVSRLPEHCLDLGRHGPQLAGIKLRAQADASTASAASCVVNVFVAGTARSAPASVRNATSAPSASGEPAPLVIARVRAPQSRAQAIVSTISSVWPDWDSATASTPERSSRLL